MPSRRHLPLAAFATKLPHRFHQRLAVARGQRVAQALQGQQRQRNRRHGCNQQHDDGTGGNGALHVSRCASAAG